MSVTREYPFRFAAALAVAFGCLLAGFARAEDSVEERVRALLAESHAGAELATNASLRVRVIEGRAAVFASTNAAREALAWLPAGTELSVRGELPDESVWVHVEPPESVTVWIYRELVRDGKVVADKSRLRSGAGLNFRAVGSLNKGTRVEVRGKYGDWLRIKPPAGLDFWMLRDQVEPLATAPAGGVAEEAEAPSEEEVMGGAETNRAPAEAAIIETNRLATWAQTRAATPPASPLPLPPELAGAALVDVPNQGAQVVLTGVLDFGMVGGGFAASFCLVARQSEGDARPVCHVLAPTSMANPYVGEPVTLEGSRWQLRGVALPVLVVHKLRSVSASANEHDAANRR